jgi:hypothetical protein
MRPWFEAGSYTFAIVGGSPALRANLRRLLSQARVEAIEIPSSTEANRTARDIANALRSCDLVVVLIRDISHSTSDQIKGPLRDLASRC